jgi:hypothetical protein
LTLLQWFEFQSQQHKFVPSRPFSGSEYPASLFHSCG